MADRKFSMDDYVDVAERIQDFKDAHADGSLQTIGWEVATVGDRLFVVYRAAAYRTADDERPGMGIAWEPFPGRTPYTKDSELMNAETAAWGRAIIALGLVANRKLASRQEVRNRMEDQKADAASGAPAPSLEEVKATLDASPVDKALLAEISAAAKALWPEKATMRDKLKFELISIEGVVPFDPNDPDPAVLAGAMEGLSVAQGVGLLRALEEKAGKS